LKTDPEQKSLMTRHHFNDVADADCVELNTCQKFDDMAIYDHFFKKKFTISFFPLLFPFCYLNVYQEDLTLTFFLAESS
jgi:hypothetical protein